MKNRQIREKAQKLGIEDAFRMNLTDVIHRIQKIEGNVPCFKTGIDGCNRMECCWRENCQQEPA